MVSEVSKRRAHDLVKLAKEKGKITKYSDFCKTKLAKDTALSKKEITYYTSKDKGAIK